MGIDYTVKYSSNVNAGKAKVTVTGIGSYSGKKNIYFIINKSKIDDGRSCLIETKGDTYTFTGNEIKIKSSPAAQGSFFVTDREAVGHCGRRSFPYPPG